MIRIFYCYLRQVDAGLQTQIDFLNVELRALKMRVKNNREAEEIISSSTVVDEQFRLNTEASFGMLSNEIFTLKEVVGSTHNYEKGLENEIVKLRNEVKGDILRGQEILKSVIDDKFVQVKEVVYAKLAWLEESHVKLKQILLEPSIEKLLKGDTEPPAVNIVGDEAIVQIVEKTLEKIRDSNVERVDYALGVSGASIDYSQTSKTYQRHQFSVPIWKWITGSGAGSPNVAISVGILPGECWPMLGNLLIFTKEMMVLLGCAFRGP